MEKQTYKKIKDDLPEQLIKDIEKFGLVNLGIYPENIINSLLKFIHHPIGSTYAFNYHIGDTLIKKKYGERPSPADFKQLLTHQFLPSDFI